VDLSGCTVSQNVLSADSGGGINAQTVTLNQCTVSGNTAVREGGGVYGTIIIILDSTVSANTAGGTSGGGGGGLSVGSALDLSASTVSNNLANVGTGGGVEFRNISSIGSRLSNSTVVGNRAIHATAGKGGGVYVPQGIGPIAIENCTIVGNSASAVNGGGALYSDLLQTNLPGLTIFSSVLSGNSTPFASNTAPGRTGPLRRPHTGSRLLCSGKFPRPKPGR
jgi:hypothetical protein